MDLTLNAHHLYRPKLEETEVRFLFVYQIGKIVAKIIRPGHEYFISELDQPVQHSCLPD